MDVTNGHGGNLRALAARSGRDPDAILDYSASINPLGPPEWLRAVISRSMDRVVHYPDPDSTELVQAIADRYGVAPQQIVAGNGSSEILVAAARGFREPGHRGRAVIPAPTYLEYASAARMAGWEIRPVALQEDEGFALNWCVLESELRPGDLVLLGQPNNPTGLVFDSERLRRLAAAYSSTHFIVDEAFADFLEDCPSLMRDVPDNVVVVRSFTKFFAVPGLRLGFAVASPDRAARIRGQIPSWSVNTLAQAVGAAALTDEEYARRTIACVAREREQLVGQLRSVAGLSVYPSRANYLLVRIDRADITAHALADRLLAGGIAIRTFGPSEHLDERFFRIAVRTAEENERLVEALAAAVGAAPRPKARRAARALMIQGTSSNAGKSVLVAALCRILLQDGVRVAPFKSQNMSLNSFVTCDGGEMGRAQVVQAQACRLEPDVRMNPILLKPCSDTGSQVVLRGKPVGNMGVGDYIRFKPEAFATAKACFDSLASEFDAIVLEGAGSPGEVNLKSHDIVNMRMAEYAGSPVLVVGDIDRGGVFASFVGTMEVLAPWERRLVAGWIVNRFRGDVTLLEPALEYTREHTGRPVFGVVPYVASLNLPQEDSVEFKCGGLDCRGSEAAVEIAVVDLPHISNFTDFDALRIESDVCLRIVRSADELGRPNAVILPGSKNTLADLDYLRRSGLAERIEALAREGRTEIVGICGGFQVLGRTVGDPLSIESSNGAAGGLGLLPVGTVMAAEKTLVRVSACHQPTGLQVTGYEIHHGRTDENGAVPLFTRSDGCVVGVADAGGRIWGTYLHGVFDADRFRRWFIDRLRVRRGLEPITEVSCRYDIEPVLDRLAEVVRRSLRMDEVYRLMGM